MGGLVRGRLLIWGDAMCLRARIRSFKPPELHFLSFYHNLEVDKDCLVTQLCLFCIVTSLKILASYTLLPLLMYSCKFQLRNSIFIIRYTITCALNDQSCRCAIKQHSFIHSLCSPAILPDFEWKVGDDLHGSDHFPIFISSTQPSSCERSKKWKLSKANWERFQVLCEQTITRDKFQDCEDPAKLFTSLLTDAAKQSVPQTSTKPKKPPKSWFTDECKQAINARKEALRRFNLRPTSDNLSQFRISRAKARLTIKNSKRKSWRQYVSKLNSRTSSKKVWDMIRKINSKCSSPINHLNVNNKELDTPRDIADALASTFAKKSSSENYSEQFQRNKAKEEKKKLSFKSNNTEHYNKLFTLKELKTALEKAHDSCPGSDKVHYQFLKHLPFTSISILLDIFNDVWQSGDFPSSWKEALVIPIPKPGKDSSDPNNYRPIALTSCLCKTLERMVNT